MKKILKNLIVNFLNKKGFEKKQIGQEAKLNLYNLMKLAFTCSNDQIISLVFSKDRAMQLDAFLGSYFENVSNYSNIIVLYRTSNVAHEQSYNDLKKTYSNLPVNFILENDFRNDLINLIDNTYQDRIVFFVDDMLFTQKIDYNLLKAVNPLENILTLSRGKDLTYSTVLAREIKVPSFSEFTNNLFRFKWDEILEFSDWTYPIGVSGYLFSRKEILSMMRVVEFKAPNSLEYSLQQFLQYFIKRGGICFEKVVTPCVHTNITQTEGYNNILGHFTIEELLELWNMNKRINFKEFMGLENSEAEIKKYNFIERE